MICPAATHTPRRPPPPPPVPTHESRRIRKKNGFFTYDRVECISRSYILTRQRARQQAISLRRGKFFDGTYDGTNEMIDVGGVNFRGGEAVAWTATHERAVERGGINDDLLLPFVGIIFSNNKSENKNTNNPSAFSNVMKNRQKKKKKIRIFP